MPLKKNQKDDIEVKRGPGRPRGSKRTKRSGSKRRSVGRPRGSKRTKRSRSLKRSLKQKYTHKQIDFAKKFINKMTKKEIVEFDNAMIKCDTHKKRQKCIKAYLKNNNKNLYNKLNKANKQFMNL